MQTWNDEQAATIRVQYPEWVIWYVTRVYGPVSWHARPKGHPLATVNAASPDELRKLLDEREAK